MEADEGGEVGRDQTKQHLGMVRRGWDFILGAVGTIGGIKQGRDLIGLKFIKDLVIVSFSNSRSPRTQNETLFGYRGWADVIS